jgi:hypothetical protein
LELEARAVQQAAVMDQTGVVTQHSGPFFLLVRDLGVLPVWAVWADMGHGLEVVEVIRERLLSQAAVAVALAVPMEAQSAAVSVALAVPAMVQLTAGQEVSQEAQVVLAATARQTARLTQTRLVAAEAAEAVRISGPLELVARAASLVAVAVAAVSRRGLAGLAVTGSALW